MTKKQKAVRRVYAARNATLRRIGFRSYQDYLNSDLWARIRAQQLEKSAYCYSCFCLATQVHHKSYRLNVLLGVDSSGLRSVCGSCHFNIEFDNNGTKRSLSKANRRLRHLRLSNKNKTTAMQNSA